MNLLSKNNLKQIDWKINSDLLNICHDLFTLNWHMYRVGGETNIECAAL